MKRLTVPLILLVAALVLVPSMVFAKATVVNIPIDQRGSFEVFDSCSGESVSGAVTTKGHLHATLDSAGGILVAIVATVQGTATGLSSGDSYIFRESVDLTVNGHAGEEITIGVRARLIGHGHTADAWVRTLIHLTVNANGDLTASKIEVTDNGCGLGN